MPLTQPPPPAPSVPVVSGRPPAGMIKAEADILTAWLNQHYQEYDSVTFNFRVGHGQDPGDDVPDYVRTMQIANTQRRVDALLTRGQAVTIVEVKVRASLWAIGQLTGYSILYSRDYPTPTRPALLLLCGSIDDDTAYVLNYLGIAFDLVLTGAPGSAPPTS